MKRACENCGYWSPNELKPSRAIAWYGQCRAIPPQGAVDRDNGFVVTENDAWCGSFDAIVSLKGDCTTCHFYERIPNGNRPEGWGECRVNPPHIDKRSSTPSPRHFPNVCKGQVCSAYQTQEAEDVF